MYFLLAMDPDADNNDAYKNVIMLTGDLDYIKGNSANVGQENYFSDYVFYQKNYSDFGDTYKIEDSTYDSNIHYIWEDYIAQKNYWGCNVNSNKNGFELFSKTKFIGVTLKSCGNISKELFWNAYGYSDCIYGNIRFDNIRFGSPPDTGKRPQKINPTMKYYKYFVSNSINEIPVVNFKKMDSGNENYIEKKNIKIDTVTGVGEGTDEFTYSLNSAKTEFKQNEVIKLSGNIKSNSVSNDIDYLDNGRDLMCKITLKKGDIRRDG